MDNRALAQVLHQIADLLEIKGENPFRIRSYRMGAESLENHGQQVAEVLRRGGKLSIPGIGDGIAGKLKELVDSGTCTYHRDLLTEVPAGLLELLKLPGLGPKGVSLVWTKLGVRSADDLEAAIADGRFRSLPGMKEKKEAKILRGLQDRRTGSQRFLLSQAEAVVRRLTAFLLERGAAAVHPVGSFRRRREAVGDLDLIVVGGDPAALSAAFTTHPEVKEVLAHGEAKSSVLLADSGLQVDFRPFLPESLGAGLQYFTGSKAHNIALRERALKRGLKLNEYGVYRTDNEEKVAGATEEEVYAALGLPWIPPEMREDRGEIEAAQAGTLPRLLEASDIHGDLHCHTNESDGRDSLEDMVAAARKRGLGYLALTDHSRAIPSRLHRQGMDEARCLEHLARIRAYQKKVSDIRLLAGIEVCILPDGRLDMADEVLAQLDVVVGSLHSAFDQPSDVTTKRLLRAFENPHLDIWGHPLGRMMPRREGVACDLDAVFAAAARAGVTLEVNSQPERLDLPDHLIRPARDAGLKFVVSTDSHSTQAFENLTYGVGQARRGWLRAEDVLNTRDAEGLLRGLRPSSLT